jgi:hypothetical protein
MDYGRRHYSDMCQAHRTLGSGMLLRRWLAEPSYPPQELSKGQAVTVDVSPRLSQIGEASIKATASDCSWWSWRGSDPERPVPPLDCRLTGPCSLKKLKS